MHNFVLWNDPIFLPIKGQISRSHSTTTSSSLRLILSKINKLTQVEVVGLRLTTTTSKSVNSSIKSTLYIKKRTYRGNPILTYRHSAHAYAYTKHKSCHLPQSFPITKQEITHER